jgi:hypothetical protein
MLENSKLLLEVTINNFVRRSEQWDDRVADGCVQQSFEVPEAFGSDMKRVVMCKCTTST